ncbi:DUF4408 domain-containing protein [Citrus sinensis]|uniref:uncharacterized protein LOC102627872 n=1 Tax=Citrus sinensis TaxID=2711 RepID=UPI0003D75AFE|nr:uncharacterized protein LOC102627872 [Citrus sinensis]KAH9650940.1 DUF4408 domain-containing protein [Citrus sinensis]
MSIIFLKAAAVSTCVLSVGVVLKHSSVAPFISEFLASDVPSFWNLLLQWLEPPFLYLLINAIIISIVASSKLLQKGHHIEDDQISVFPPPDKVIAASTEVSLYDHIRPVQDLSDDNKTVMMKDGGDGVAEVVGDVKTTPPPKRSDSMEFSDSSEKESRDKPPVSTRFGHRKAVKANPEGGRALRVAKSKRNDTLESTWKTITEGRAMPLTRHLKKSDTWDSHVRQNSTAPAPKVKKAETFHERTTTTATTASTTSGGSGEESANGNSAGRLRREPSLSQDELNRRVEAFIKKFNEEMRLQRQRSLEQYNQMINRGAN